MKIKLKSIEKKMNFYVEIYKRSHLTVLLMYLMIKHLTNMDISKI